MRTARLTCALFALSIVVPLAASAGCGGGGSVSQQDFQAEANRVCRDAEQQLNRIQRSRPRTADQAAKQAGALVDVSNQALDNLRQIAPPDSEKAAYDRYLTAREKAIGFIAAARDAAAGNDARAYVRAKTRLANEQPQRRQLALRVGLGACSRPTLPTSSK